MKIVIEGLIVRQQYSWSDYPTYSFYPGSSDWKDDEDRIKICDHTIEVEVPDDDMISQRVAGVHEAIRQAYVACEETVMELRNREAKLLALTNEVEES